MTIKWVVSDPLVMNGEPFCYGTRLTVRNILELRSSGYTLSRMLKDHPELEPMSRVGLVESFRCARLALWDETTGRLVSFREVHAV